MDVIMPDSVREQLKKRALREEQITDQMMLVIFNMQRITSRLIEELKCKDKAAIETHKEFVKKVEELGPIIKEFLEAESNGI